MATRMQQRRGTAAQWSSANPILAAGEIGFETDTGKFKLGNGSSTWSSLNYFVDGSTLIDGAPDLLNTLNELAAALGDDPAFFTTVATNLSNHEADTTNVHGIADTALLATTTDVTNHNNDTTGVHGINDTSLLALVTDVSTAQSEAESYADSAVSTHNSDTTQVHGIADTSALALLTDVSTAQAAAESHADSAVSTHNSDTTQVHGIADTSVLTTTTDVNTLISAHNSDTTNVHGIADTADLVLTSDARLSDTRTPTDNTVTTEKIANSAVTADKIAGDAVTESKLADGAVTSGKIANGTIVDADINASAAIAQSKVSGLTSDLALKAPLADPTFTGTVSGITKSMIGLGNVDNTSDANKPVSTATQTALDLKANLAGPTFTGTTTAADVTITGNLTVQGTTTTVEATDLVVTDPLIYIGEGNTANLVDLGLVSSFDNGTYQHSGLVRDASDNKWKLFKGVTDEPTTTVNFTQGSMDDLKVAALEATTVTPSSGVVFTDGTQTKEGVPSRTPIIQKTDSYTLSALTERDSLIEVSKATAATITVPTNATVAYPVGTSIDILQTGAGQVTIAGASGVTVNGTPGLKLRTQWSSATLFKRATDTWVVMGDLSA